ncbi:MAG: AAA family ATPase, partial [Burkholderiales bacterium]|nr:AAA family ATPase [Burkholderiales bacterium]
MALHAYLPQDRLRALARGEALPERCHGTALFADIAGFTALTEALTQGSGQRRGVEELARRINAVHQALIAEVERQGGSVIGFAGDGMTCWFDADNPDHALAPSLRALGCAQRMQRAMDGFAQLSVKVGIGSGAAQRLVVGDPAIHRIDLLAGATVARAVLAEGLAAPGEVVVDAATAAALPAPLGEPRPSDGGEAFYRVDAAPPDAPSDEVPMAPPPSLDLETLRPWVLPFVFERESAGEGLFATDLRPATALFLRLVQPDENSAALAEQVALAQRTLQQHGGVLLEVTVDAVGSCLYGNFGAAQVHEDDAARALRAALALRQRLDDAAGTLQIGLSSGTLCVGGYGGATRRSFGAIGDEVNLAARLMAQARPGEILVSGRVRQAVADEFAFEARPPIAVKGKAEPMPVFAVAGLQQRRAIRLQEPAALLPMVGRAAETAQLARKLAAALGGRGQVLRIVAEAGMGKSRLLAEGIRLARRAGFIGYGGACRMDGIRTPYLVWQGIWTAFFDLDPALPQRRQRQAVQAALHSHAPEHAEAWPLLGTVLGQDWPDTAFTAALQPQDRKSLLEAVLLRCLQSAAQEAAEDGMGLLLVLLARGIEALPVLLLIAQRPADTETDTNAAIDPLATLAHAESIELTGLSPADVEHIVRAKLALLFPERVGALPRELFERIAARAQGNPFYVEELLNYLHDRGLDPREPRALQALELPTSLHSLVLSRMDRLALSQQRGLKAAAIIGREFKDGELHGYCPTLGSAEAVRADLIELDRLGFTPRQPDAPQPSHVFKHLVTLEVSYESIAHDTRIRLHEDYARYVVGQYPDQLGALAPQLAHHFERALCRDEAGHYLRKAGEQAAAGFANEEALAYFARALQWLAPDDEQARFELLMQRQAILDLLGRHAPQRVDLAELERLAPRLDHAVERQAEVAIERARLDIAVGDYAAARAGALAAITAIEADAPTRERASGLLVDALLLETRALFFAGQAALARPTLERALALARAGGHARGE